MTCPVIGFLTAMTGAEKLAGRTEPPKGYTYTSIADYVLRNSQCSCGRKMTSDELEFIKHARERCEKTWGSPRMKECYANAQKLVINAHTDRLVYAEGYAVHQGSILPVLHGWAELEGAIIDPAPTWLDKGLGFSGDDYCYHAAIRVEWKDILERAVVRGEMGSYIDDWVNRFPLLRGE